MQQKIVITGGPSTGKSTLIQGLSALSYCCMEEVSRELTIEAKKNGIDQLFLTDPLLFSELLLKKREEQFLEASKLNFPIVFFDRGIPDIQAYLNFFKQTYPFPFEKINESNTYQKVFITPPWEDIHTTDNERYESFSEAVEIHNSLTKTYSNLGYQLIEIPFGTPEERVAFVLKNCGC